MAKKIHADSLTLRSLTIEKRKRPKAVVFAQQLTRFDSKKPLMKPPEKKSTPSKEEKSEVIKWNLTDSFFKKVVEQFRELDEKKDYILASKNSLFF